MILNMKITDHTWGKGVYSQQWWDNDQLKFEITTKDGIIDTFTSWYRNGQKEREGIYKDGEPILYNSWNENGEICVKDGNGKEINWFDNGQKAVEGYYKNKKKHGLWTHWYENGQKKGEGIFKDGKLIYNKLWNEDDSVKE